MLVLEERDKKTGVHREKPLRAEYGEPTNSAHILAEPGNRTRPHWWKANALPLRQPCSPC